MSWIEDLYETYEKNCTAELSNTVADLLLPICHTTQVAHIEVIISDAGEFLSARPIEKEESQSIVPCTEKSATRSGCKPVNHPLADKLQYLAGDFIEYGGEVTSGYAKEPNKPYSMYLNELRKWCESEYSHWKAEAILKYVEKSKLVQDLVRSHILFVSESSERNGKLLYEWTGDDEKRPPVFALLPGKITKNKRGQWQADALVRWRVEKFGSLDSSTQFDKELQNAWISYYSSLNQTKGLCLISGKDIVLATSHPGKIRNAGDKAKLISSNDSSGFTYRGRFTDDSQVCGVGFDLSQKAHNALRWLLHRQGWQSGDMAVVSWALCEVDVPGLLLSTNDLFGDEDELETVGYTAQETAIKLSKYIAGYASKFKNDEKIIVMGLDSATPGRMAVTFYRSLGSHDFLKRVETWHSSCCWMQDYGKNRRFIGAPSPNDIAKTAYGNNVHSKLKAATIIRILPCIVDGVEFPEDIVCACVNRVKRRESMNKWEWNKALGVTCAVYRNYFKEKENYSMALDKKRNTRSYLFGRLLAVADGIEQWALNQAGEKRQTNAARLMTRFSNYPCGTWKTIELGLAYYKARLGPKTRKYDNELSAIMELFNAEDFVNDEQPLSGEFLLGYHCQRAELFKSNKEKEEGDNK